jgi:hypothetical protein
VDDHPVPRGRGGQSFDHVGGGRPVWDVGRQLSGELEQELLESPGETDEQSPSGAIRQVREGMRASLGQEQRIPWSQRRATIFGVEGDRAFDPVPQQCLTGVVCSGAPAPGWIETSTTPTRPSVCSLRSRTW